ncbi:MAG: type II toxin-antitoxin system RelE/ParE family toxin, partial [Betaproteobacteria bacterium]
DADRQPAARVRQPTAGQPSVGCTGTGGVYYAQAGRRLILLLVGGDKRHQQSDIKQAQEYWADWQHRRKLK